MAPDIASVISDGKARPAPTPSRTIAGAMSIAYVASTGVRAKSSSATMTKTIAGRSVASGPEAQVELPREPEGHRSHDDRQRQVRKPDLQRAVAEDPLQVQGSEEEHPEHAHDQQRLDEVGSGDVGNPKQAQRHQRVGDSRLAHDERGQQRERDGPERQRLGRPPALLGTPRIVYTPSINPPISSTAPGRIGARREADPGSVLDQPDRERRGRDPDRHVDEEDPVPVDRLGEDPTRQQPDRTAGDGDERVDADRLRLIPGLREHGHDHPQDHRGRQGAPDALDEARPDQHALALGHRAQQRRAGEHPEADQEDASLADQVADPSGEQQQAAERDQVGVDDPGEVVLREAQVVLDRRQGDVHDRRVEDDHQHAHAEHVEREPPRAVVGRAHRFRMFPPTGPAAPGVASAR